MRDGSRAGAANAPAAIAYHRRWARLRAEFVTSGDGAALVRARAGLLDRLVLDVAASRPAATLEAAEFCLVATGAWGRRELFPHSEADLLLLFDRQPAQGPGRRRIEDFLGELRATGLGWRHSVRLLADCIAPDPHDPGFTIGLLEARLVAGDRGLFDRLREALPRLVVRERDALAHALVTAAGRRHAQFEHTIHHLEPDVKESPGGLEDWRLVRRLALLLRGDQKRLPGEEELFEIAGADMRAAYAFLCAARCALHFLTGQDSNLLTFDMQGRVAETFAPLAQREGESGMGPEQWMRRYFRHARGVHRQTHRSLRQAEAPRAGLLRWFEQRKQRFSNADFVVHGGEVFLRNPIAAQRDPGLWLDLFEFQARHGVLLGAETEHRLQRQLPELAGWARQARDLWPRLRRILALPRAYDALAEMHELGALGELLPEFRLIESLVVRDLYHCYTVDEHCLQALRRLHELRPAAGDEPAHAPPGAAPPGAADQREHAEWFAGLLGEIGEPHALFLALLLHDLGKGDAAAASEEGGVLRASARLAEGVLQRLAMDETECDTVRFLVANQHLMASMIGGRDIADPAVARELAASVETAERLAMLCLHTWADMQSVNPGAMTPWKQWQLRQLYTAALEELTRRLDSDRAIPAETALVFPPEVARFLEGFPRRYLKTHAPAELLAHFRMAGELPANPVRLSLSRRHGHHRLLLLTTDHPFLFAAVTGTLAALGMNILKAEAFSNRRGIVLDTFLFDDLRGGLERNPRETERLLDAIEGAVLGKVDVAALIGMRLDSLPPGRTTFSVETRLRFQRAPTGASTLLEVEARDRPGLLYRISNVLSAHGCNIEVVLVDTQGHKAVDVFYITRGGGALDADWEAALDKELRRVLGG